MLPSLRSPRWRRRALWFRGFGLVLLLVSFFLDLPTAVLLTVLLSGLALFLAGAFVWLVREGEPWLRPR